MLRRTELEPMSTAAKTGMADQACWVRIAGEESERGCFFATGVGANRRPTADLAVEYRVAKRERISTSRAQLSRPPNCFSVVFNSVSQSCHSPIASWTDLMLCKKLSCSGESAASSAV